MGYDTIINWWKLGNDPQLLDLINSVLLVWQGTKTYLPCKFDDGSYSNVVGNRLFAASDGSFFNPNKYVFTGWVNTDYVVSSGGSGDGARHNYFSWRNNATNRIFIHTLESAIRTRMISQIGGTFHIYIISTAGFSWAASTNANIMFVKNRLGIEGGPDIRRAYVDGIQVANSVVAVPNQPLVGGSYTLLDFFNGSWPLDGIEDNIQIFNDTTELAAIIANINNEDPPVSGRPIANKFNFERYRGAA